MNKKLLPSAIAIGSLVIIALAVFFITMRLDNTLEIKLIDSVSKAWVWNAEVKIDGRFTRMFYQSDTGSRTYTFSDLVPGTWELSAEAPDYTGVKIPVTISPGRNRLKSPIELAGFRIPGMKEVFVYKDRDPDNLILNPRPIDANGQGIGRHPCIDMWFGLRISVQTANGVFVRVPAETGSERGEVLFEGKLDWTWDSYPDAFYRYGITLPKSSVKRHNAPYNVYDYVIIFPDPRKITKKEIDETMTDLVRNRDVTKVTSALEGLGDKIAYFITTDWNQPSL